MIKDHYEMIRKSKIAFWWFLGRRDLFTNILGDHIKAPVNMAVDIGCGPGTNETLYPLFAKNWLALDHSKESFKGRDTKNGSLILLADVLNLPVKSGSAELCLMLDVLEHIDDEQRVLSEIHRILRNDGLILISVPAFNCLWSYHDEQAGHKKRYRKKGLQSVCEESGFEILGHYYFNTLLFIPIFLIRKFLRILPQGKKTLEMNLSPKYFDKLFCFILKLENFVNLKLFKLPFGTSIVALLRKKDERK